MAIKGQGITIVYTAWDAANQAGKTGDAANHTLRVIGDGSAAEPTNAPAEVDATNCPGEYRLVLTADEMDADTVVVAGTSSTADVIIVPVRLVTERGRLDATVGSRAAEATLTDIQGGGWSATTDTLERIRDAVANVPAQRQTQEL
jgi:hypothetical protein